MPGFEAVTLKTRNNMQVGMKDDLASGGAIIESDITGRRSNAL
jgi:hypothetical protein